MKENKAAEVYALNHWHTPFDNPMKLSKECQIAYDAFLAGVEWMKEEQKKNTLEGLVTNAGGEYGYDVAVFEFDDFHRYSVLLPHTGSRNFGDKIKLIVDENRVIEETS